MTEEVMAEEVMRPLSGFGNEELLNEWALLAANVKQELEEMGRIEMVLHRRMVTNESRTIAHTHVDCEMGPPTPIVDRLMSLREVVGEAEFNKAFTSAHERTRTDQVPDKFNMTVVNGWMKQGNHIREVIAYGTDPETARLSLKLKKDKPHDK
jgi:hypothetical protein